MPRMPSWADSGEGPGETQIEVVGEQVASILGEFECREVRGAVKLVVKGNRAEVENCVAADEVFVEIR